jgi:L-alanine-DL-glutamate epimerase-like enolase superfamily enzyme
MKITDIKYERLKVKFNKPFVIALGVVEYGETMIVKVTTDEGLVGYGEASPFAPVTGETLDSVPVALELFRSALIGFDPFEIEKIHKTMDRLIVGNTSAKASIDIAMYDLMGKKIGIPVYKLLGGYRKSYPTDMTVGIGETHVMAQDALDYVNEGYNCIKVKAGISAEADVEAIKRIREAVGNGVHLRVDANQGWDVSTAIRVMSEYEKYGVEAVEQPLVFWDFDGMAYVRSHTSIPIMADESLHSPQDAMKLAKKQAVDIFNIKLMKSQGLYPAMRINAIGESCGITCMLGCMIETRLGISAAASLVAAQKNVTEADLDSFRHYDDSVMRGGFTLENGVITMLDKPGLGVEVDF